MNAKRRASLKDLRRLRQLAMLLPNEIALRQVLDQVKVPEGDRHAERLRYMRGQVFFAMQRHLRFAVSRSLVTEMTTGMRPWRLWWHLKWRRVRAWWKARTVKL